VTVEFVGMIGASYYSESSTPDGPAVDQAYLRKFARAYDDGGFDWTLVPYGSAAPESNQLAAAVLSRTERLKVMLAHRPGVLFPTNAARAFATLDQLSDGRLGIHFLAGGSDAEQRREGDYWTRTNATRGPASTSASCAAPGPARNRSATTATTTASRTTPRRCSRCTAV
jgi:alkanesulfonate monooxygenase